MNIQTQALVHKLHELKVKLQLHQNKVGYDFCTETYIQDAIKLLDWFPISGNLFTNKPISKESFNEISSYIEDVEQYIRQL